MKKANLTPICAIAACVLVCVGVNVYYDAAMPQYRNAIGYDYYPEKLKGTYLVSQAAEKGDNLFVLGSSELNTTMIASHPSNFFQDNDPGFQVCLIGRGSCQSLIHALNAAAFSLQGQKLVLISSPQHFIPGGIEPDMFVANFSPLQLGTIIADSDLDDSIKRRLAIRTLECLDRYEAEIGSLSGYESVRLTAGLYAGNSVLLNAANALLKPYYLLDNWLLELKDRHDSKQVIQAAAEDVLLERTEIDWDGARADMALLGAEESDNNDFQMLNDYYATNVGSRLRRMADKDAELSYSKSVEYEDLILLMDVCRAKGLDVMYVHIPLNGAWSDYTGFTGEKRQDYYDKVRQIVSSYDVELLDLTGNEYADYYLCDVMHIGWTGWIDIDEAICKFYYGDR